MKTPKNTFITKYGEIVKVLITLDNSTALCVSLDSGEFIKVSFRDLGIPDWLGRDVKC